MTDRSSGSLRISVVHSFYSSRQPSGENVVVDLQVAALRQAGHEVQLIARRTDELATARAFPLKAALTVASGLGPSPLEEIEAFSPDIVHVHNTFPNYGRRWATSLGRPLVATLHNYRPLCPAGILFRDGHSCTLCPDGRTARPSVRYGCYKDSRVATVPVAIGTRFDKDPLLAAADAVIALNDSMLDAYVACGVHTERLVTIPNFVSAAPVDTREASDRWLFVGRLSREKGVDRLVREWPVGPRLLVVGSGDLEAELGRIAGSTVEFAGQLSNDQVRCLLGNARGLVFPSVWPEGLPTIYLEALAAGLPVLASPESVVGGLVRSERTGLVMGESLAESLAQATELFPRLREHCRDVYQARYTQAAWVDAVTELYRGLLG